MSPLTDREVYQRLNGVADELERLAEHGASLIGETALLTAAQSVRGMAKAVYEHALSQSDNDDAPH
jgi:hypothetical protein